MGDRAMAEIKTEGGSLYVYTHWGGHDLPDAAKEAVLSARDRWGDYTYATRIIVDQLIKPSRDLETGHGLTLSPDAEDEYNNDNPSVVIDLIKEKLTIIRDGEAKSTPFREIEWKRRITSREYMEARRNCIIQMRK